MCSPHRVALVDDEAPTRRLLKRIVDDHERFRVVAEARTGREAIEVIRQQAPALIFLDVSMPGHVDGFDVLHALPPAERPLVIVCTGHEDYALDAFAEDAIDYVLKPIHEKRVLAALDRAALRLGRPDAEEHERLERMLLEAQRVAWVQRLPVRHGDRIEFVELDDVEWIGAAANYVELHVDGHRHLVRSTLKDLVAKLDPRVFARIHRSTAVNLTRIHELRVSSLGDWFVRLDTGVELRLSRQYHDVLRRLRCAEASDGS